MPRGASPRPGLEDTLRASPLPGDGLGHRPACVPCGRAVGCAAAPTPFGRAQRTGRITRATRTRPCLEAKRSGNDVRSGRRARCSAARGVSWLLSQLRCMLVVVFPLWRLRPTAPPLQAASPIVRSPAACPATDDGRPGVRARLTHSACAERCGEVGDRVLRRRRVGGRQPAARRRTITDGCRAARPADGWKTAQN